MTPSTTTPSTSNHFSPAESRTFSSPNKPTGRDSFSPPSSILIVGSGVFGLSTAYSLSQHYAFKNTTITLLDRSEKSDNFPAEDAASVDTSRIIRPDYADPLYARLAVEAQHHWRKSNLASTRLLNPSLDVPLGDAGIYHETGLVLVTSLDSSNANYVKESFKNAKALARAAGTPDVVVELPSFDAIKSRVGTGGASGTWGYVNESSGWANAGAAMKWLFGRVKATGRVKMVSGKAVKLLTTASFASSADMKENDKISIHDTVSGVRLQSGSELHADLVILAAGAWTGSLLDLPGQIAATAQTVAYLPISDGEQQQLSKMPVLLDISTGYFVFPPADNMLKVARHAYGYWNHVSIPPPLSLSPTHKPSTTVSLPVTHLDLPSLELSREDVQQLHNALRCMVPLEDFDSRPFCKTRLCWYADTPTGDFLVDYHPTWKGLFIATGGSGHAFKFLPILGDKVIDCLMGTAPEDIRTQWSWMNNYVNRANSDAVTQDGSRAGRPCLNLQLDTQTDHVTSRL